MYNADSGCRFDDFLCSNQKCVQFNLTCNGNNDCGDWSDELRCRGTSRHLFYGCTYNKYEHSIKNDRQKYLFILQGLKAAAFV